ncbi:MAG: hypothetical protein ACOCWY_04440 [Thermodesulfobacteriota bacterium]
MRTSSNSLFSDKRFLILFIVLVLLIGGIVFLFFTNEEVSTELRQVREPMPNQFFVGIDVSATISTDILEKLKKALISRLRNFIGDEAVSYTVTTFGNPGCGMDSVSRIVSTRSPDDPMAFSLQVEDDITEIDITKVAPRDTEPLTTPLYCFLENTLPRHAGGRIIIFSDLLNDDSDCEKQFIFPENAIVEFGKNKSGQIIFLYPTPHLTDNPDLNQRIRDKQNDFIARMKALSSQGKVRAFFYHIPDDPLETLEFIRSQIQNAIPTTTFDVVWERTSKVLQTIVSAVRG